MKKNLQSSAMYWLLGMLCAAVPLAGCQKTDSATDVSADEAVTRGYDFDGGAIPDLIELNKTHFDYGFEVPSLKGSSLPYPKYQWEINTGSQWVDYKYATTEGLTDQYIGSPDLPCQRTIKLRRAVASTSNPTRLYSNECTITDYAFQEDPQWGTDPGDNAVKLGPYSDDFSVSLLFDTRGEYFRDFDRISYYGNDAYMRLTLTKPMFVDIVTGSTPMFVRLAVWSEEEGEYKIHENTSRPLFDIWGTDYIPFPTFDYSPDTRIVSLELNAGEYLVQVQGGKATNAGTVNFPISISMRGTTDPHPIPSL